MPIYEAADKALKTFQEEFMPVETFSEFLDAAGQCQGFIFQRSPAAEPMCATGGLVLACIFTAAELLGRTSLLVPPTRSAREMGTPGPWE